ncbi:MAG: recombinase RecT [Gemmatimonadaceae bacterium]|nr:recombinase RecT [Gemmatimonadaceae bacterium]
MSNGTAAVSVKDNATRIEHKLIEMEERIAAFCPPGMTPASVRHSVMMALGNNRSLLEARWETVVMSAVVITQWGLEIGRTAHIVPYKGVATPIADYKGYIELMMATRLVKNVNAREIRELDQFEYEDGDQFRLLHRPHWRNKNSPIIGAYCLVPTVAGGVIHEVMSLDEIEAIRKNSHQWSPSKVRELPYWYARKTVVRRTAKSAPKSPRLALLAQMDYDTTPSEETLDRLTSAEPPQLGAGAPVYEPTRQAPAIAQPANGYGDGEPEDIGGLL